MKVGDIYTRRDPQGRSHIEMLEANAKRERPPKKQVDKCECCCVNESIGVASSTLGAFSIRWCAECNRQNAEPLAVLCHLIKDCQGDVSDWVKELTAFHNGEYIRWDKIKDIALNSKTDKPEEEKS